MFKTRFISMLVLLAAVVTGTVAQTIDLSTLTADYTAQDGATLTGKVPKNVKISIADGATVTLDGVDISGQEVDIYNGIPGIDCLGDATIILKGENTVSAGRYWEEDEGEQYWYISAYSGIYVHAGKTLTIKGNGKLTANGGDGPGIGGAYQINGGNIEIQGGTIIATGGYSAAGIGGGDNASCGYITITTGVTSVTATKLDPDAPYSIGAGYQGSCGTVTIGGTVTGPISTNPYTYEGNPTPTGYTVSMPQDTPDAEKWTARAGTDGTYQQLPLEGVALGAQVSLKYGGALKVKSVKAKKKAAPAATVTTAPTAKTGVKAGEDVAIVNEGAAEGGTMMYMVNATQPASTDGFSATVPTAEGLTAGTYYVWYYVKADDSHTDSEISASGIEVTIASAYTMAAAATSADKGKLICTDGHIHAYGADAACTKARVAKIIYRYHGPCHLQPRLGTGADRRSQHYGLARCNRRLLSKEHEHSCYRCNMAAGQLLSVGLYAGH